jgi:ribosomal protein S8
MIGHSVVVMPSSRLKVAIANILKTRNIQDFEIGKRAARMPCGWLKYVGDRRHRVLLSLASSASASPLPCHLKVECRVLSAWVSRSYRRRRA